MKRLYVITCNDKISTLAFNEFEDAVAWVENRGDKPKRDGSNWIFTSKHNVYKIHGLEVK